MQEVMLQGRRGCGVGREGQGRTSGARLPPGQRRWGGGRSRDGARGGEGQAHRMFGERCVHGRAQACTWAKRQPATRSPQCCTSSYLVFPASIIGRPTWEHGNGRLLDARGRAGRWSWLRVQGQHIIPFITPLPSPSPFHTQVIKRFIMHAKKTAFIVEHDFIMATYMADRVIVYEGEPSKHAFARTPQTLQSGERRASALPMSICAITSISRVSHIALQICPHGTRVGVV